MFATAPPTSAPRPPKPRTVAQTVEPDFFQLVAPGHAWIATVHMKVFVTNNGGRAWSNVTPPLHGLQNPFESVGGLVATDSRHAILAVVGELSHTATLFATADGGATWVRTDIAGYGSDWFSVVDDRDLWLESGQGGAANQEAADVWHTTDGGLHWTEMSRGPRPSGETGSPGALGSGCDKAGIGFANPTTGFATGVCIIGFFFEVTHDAGHTWQPATLPLPPEATTARIQADTYEQETGPPVFDADHGAGTMIGTVVVGQQATSRAYFYFTTDAGSHWLLCVPPVRATWAVAIDATHWWAGNGAIVVATSDGGAHWTTLHSNINARTLGGVASSGALQFASDADGWLFTTASGAGRLLQTHDGGRTWRPVPLPVVATRA